VTCALIVAGYAFLRMLASFLTATANTLSAGPCVIFGNEIFNSLLVVGALPALFVGAGVERLGWRSPLLPIFALLYSIGLIVAAAYLARTACEDLSAGVLLGVGLTIPTIVFCSLIVAKLLRGADGR